MTLHEIDRARATTPPRVDRRATIAIAVAVAGLLGMFGLAGETAGRFPAGSTVIALIVLTLAATGIVLSAAARRRARADAETGLPTLHALARGASRGPLTVAVAHIADYATVTRPLSGEDRAILLGRIAERLSLGAAGTPVYRVGEDALGWIVDPDAVEAADDRFAALAAIMRAPLTCGGRSIDVAISFALADGRGRDAGAVVAAGRAAARRAHLDGRRWAYAGADDRDGTDWTAGLAGELDRAIRSGAVWVAYQPKQDIATDRITAVEALARWQHPRRGNIPPDLFVPRIEQAGRADVLTAHVLDTALADAASWQRIGRPIGVAVNISATLLAGDMLVPEIAAALARYRIPPAMLTLEVTESAAIASADAAIARLEELRDLGVAISIDDYGTGQSTMTYLKRFPATELKIDKSFVKGLAASGSDMILVRSTIDLAHALGMTVVAEGVEDAACLDRLRELGCDVAQGWHIGKPMPAENLALMQAWQRAA